MDQHTAQVIFQVLMARTPEFLVAVSQEVAHALQQDRIAKIGYQQALQQASIRFIQSLCLSGLTEDSLWTPLVFPLPDNELDVITVQSYNFSKRHFATNVHRYALDVERFYRDYYKEANVARVTVAVADESITVTLFKA